MISTPFMKYNIKLLDYNVLIKECFNRASVLPKTVLEMSEQFVLNCLTSRSGIFGLMEFARYNGNGMHFLKMNNF
jgi:hypothetical protein